MMNYSHLGILVLCSGLATLFGCTDTERHEERTTASMQAGFVAPAIMTGITQVPSLIVGAVPTNGCTLKVTCNAIMTITNVQERHQLYFKLVDSACNARFDAVGDFNAPNMRERQKVRYGLSNAYSRLGDVAEEVWSRLYLESAPASTQLEPWFRILEALKNEDLRLNDDDRKLSRAKAKYIERLVQKFYHEIAQGDKWQQEKIRIETRFKEIVGSPIQWERTHNPAPSR